MKNWIIYLWFSVGIAVLTLSTLDLSNGVALRDKSDPTTVLSILITFLVAWQIWQTIGVKQEMDDIHKEHIRLLEFSSEERRHVKFISRAYRALGTAEFKKRENGGAPDVYCETVNALLFFLLARYEYEDEEITLCLKDLNHYIDLISDKKCPLMNDIITKRSEQLNDAYEDIKSIIHATGKRNRKFLKELQSINKKRKSISEHTHK